MNNTKVSVIVAVYNVEPYLRRSMDCLLNQTLKDMEFICIDDCSTDKSLEILREYESKDSRFKIITLEKNGGAAVARNKGLDVAQGEYLGFIDPDDAIDLNYYEELYKKAKEQDYDIVKCKMNIIEKDELTITYPPKDDKIKEKGLYYFYEQWTTAIYKHSEIVKSNIRFDEEIIKSQDTVFLNKVILNLKTISVIDNVCYYYFRRENSLDSEYLKPTKLKSKCNAYKIILDDLNESGLFDKDRDAYFFLYWLRMISLLKSVYKNEERECRLYCVETFIKYYNECKTKNLFETKNLYKKIFNLAKANKSDDIIDLLTKYSNLSDCIFYINYKPIEKIFSVKNTSDNMYKVVMILGKSIKLKKTNCKKLTIITVCYNEPNLEETCKSIVNQTWQDFEWIVVDGGSNEETQKIWDKYKYRIDKFISEPDKGVYNAMNKGIKLATGKYLNFLNAGDYYYDINVLDSIFNKENYTEDILYGNQINGNAHNKLRLLPQKINRKFFILHSLSHASTFIKSDIFDKYGLYREDLKIISDRVKFIECANRKAKFRYIPLTMTYFQGGGISTNDENRELHKKEIATIQKEYFTQKELYLEKNMPKLKMLEQIFSVRNTKDKKYKILTVLGVKFCSKEIKL